MRGFGKGIQPGRARSILEKTNDHRRFIRGCKRRAGEAHVKNSRPVPDRREARLLRFFRQADTREATSGGRGERIRTSGLYVPNVALYQAKLHPDLVRHRVGHVAERFKQNDLQIENTILAELPAEAMRAEREERVPLC